MPGRRELRLHGRNWILPGEKVKTKRRAISDTERLDLLIQKAKESRSIIQDTQVMDVLCGGRTDIDAAILASRKKR